MHPHRSPKKSKDKKRDRDRDRKNSENGADSDGEEKVFVKPKEKVEPLSLEELLEKKRKEEEVYLIIVFKKAHCLSRRLYTAAIVSKL